MLKNKIKLVALDLDGTLTQHKSALSPECRETLARLSERYRLLMICAGGCERVYRQMGSFPVDICGWYGMQFSTVRDGRFVLEQSRRVPCDKAQALRRVEALRKELGYTRYAGESVEFHASGMLTFPLLGTDAVLSDKLAFDPHRRKRRACYERVRAAFPEYTVFVGGSSSFDIAPLPFCKLYALGEFLAKTGIERAETVYFGDDYGPGGNDEDIFASDIECVPIDDYRDFPEIARKMLL